MSSMYLITSYNSGMFGERLPLRYYLTAGMLLSGLFTSLFGLGFYWNIHSLWYYCLVQVKPTSASSFPTYMKSLPSLLDA